MRIEGAQNPKPRVPDGTLGQNHGFSLDSEGLEQRGAIVSYVNINDHTVEGLRHVELPLLSIQFHPEAAPGPNDSVGIVQQFVEMIEAA